MRKTNIYEINYWNLRDNTVLCVGEIELMEACEYIKSDDDNTIVDIHCITRIDLDDLWQNMKL